MNVFAKSDEIPSMTLQDIKETNLQDIKETNVTDTLSFGQRENSIPSGGSHKHSLRGL